MNRILTVLVLFILFSSCDKAEENSASIEISYPDGNEYFVKGFDYSIVWSCIVETRFNIDLFNKNEFVQTIASDIPDNKFKWKIPSAIKASSDYSIRITNTENYISESSTFEIRDQNETSEFIDKRDGKKYKTVKIGNQWWMAENFQFETNGTFCYSKEFCKEHGLLYTWNAAISSAPEGWHLPSDEEWKQLEIELGVNASEVKLEGSRGVGLRTKLYIGGSSGFNFQWAGYYNARIDGIGHTEYDTRFWTSSNHHKPENIWVRYFNAFEDVIFRVNMQKDYGASVRYVKDLN